MPSRSWIVSPRIVALVIGMLWSCQLVACKLAPGYVPFLPDVPARSDIGELPAPHVEVASLRRANLAAGHSCRDIALLTLSVPDDAVGYRLTRIDGFLGFPLPEGFVAPARSGSLGFIWIESVHTAGLPIGALVEVTTLTRDGRLSGPQRLWIENTIE